MSTQDISSFLSDIQKLKEQADTQSKKNPRFALASQKLEEILLATETLDKLADSDDKTLEISTKSGATAALLTTAALGAAATQATISPSSDSAAQKEAAIASLNKNTTNNEAVSEKPAPLTKWWRDKEGSDDTKDTAVVAKVKSGFFTKIVKKKHLAKEPTTLRTDRKISENETPPLLSVKTPQVKLSQSSILTAPVHAQDTKGDDNSSLITIAAAGVAGAAALGVVASTADTSADTKAEVTQTVAENTPNIAEPKSLEAATLSTKLPAVELPPKIETDLNVEAATPSVETDVAITSLVTKSTTENIADAAQEAALYAKASAGQFEDRSYEAGHVKAQIAPEDMPAEKELLTSVSQGKNDKVTALTATTAATIASGRSLAETQVSAVTEVLPVVDLPDPDIQADIVESAAVSVETTPEIQEHSIEEHSIEVATEDPRNSIPEIPLVAAASAVAAAGLASIALSDTEVPTEPQVDSHLTGVIELSDPQPGVLPANEEIQLSAPLEEMPAQIEPEFVFAQELPEDGLASSAAASTPIAEATSSLEHSSMQKILTTPTPIAASIETQAEHEIDISHITTGDLAPTAEIPPVELPEVAPILEDVVASPVVEAPILETITTELPEVAPILEDVPASPTVEAPILETITTELPEVAPIIEDVAASPTVETPALEAIPTELPEIAPIIKDVAVSPVAEAPILETIPTEMPEVPQILEMPVAAPIAATPKSAPPLANIPLASPAVGESVLVSQPTGQSLEDTAAAAQSHTIPTAQQDGLKVPDLAINSEKVILSGDDIKFHPEYGVKKKGFFARLFMKPK